MSKRGDTSAALKSAPSENLVSVLKKFYDEYMTSTSKRLKIVDAYLVYILLTGVIQFVYCALVGTFPFNSFLSGFISTVGSFVLAVCLRLQVNPQNKTDFVGISPERAFADFIFAHV
uniref:Dolichyl-diphosphooligosaccharide--protein glycosyltransferase subunit DAD1 n=1 Tax=Magallana gigas TaxID=29159 RepID=K1PNV6_MAGGI